MRQSLPPFCLCRETLFYERRALWSLLPAFDCPTSATGAMDVSGKRTLPLCHWSVGAVTLQNEPTFLVLDWDQHQRQITIALRPLNSHAASSFMSPYFSLALVSRPIFLIKYTHETGDDNIGCPSVHLRLRRGTLRDGKIPRRSNAVQRHSAHHQCARYQHY